MSVVSSLLCPPSPHEAGTFRTEDRPLRDRFDRLLLLLSLTEGERDFIRAALAPDGPRALWLVVADYLEERGRADEAARCRRAGREVAAPAYHVRPLEWSLVRDNIEGVTWWMASTIFGDLHVESGPDRGPAWRYCFDEYYDEGQHDCASLEEGKVAAEAFYLSRLLPALGAVAREALP